MSLIYRTITGALECTMEGGLLFERDYYGATKSEWRHVDTTVKKQSRLLKLLDKQVMSRSDRDAAERRHYIRILCLKGQPSEFYASGTTQEQRLRTHIKRLQEEIAALEAKLPAAIAADLADRPKLPTEVAQK